MTNYLRPATVEDIDRRLDVALYHLSGAITLAGRVLDRVPVGHPDRERAEKLETAAIAALKKVKTP